MSDRESTTERAGQVRRMEERFGSLMLSWAAAKPRFPEFTEGALTHLTDRVRCLQRDLDIAIDEASAPDEETQESDVAGLAAAAEGEAEAQLEQHRGRYAARRR